MRGTVAFGLVGFVARAHIGELVMEHSRKGHDSANSLADELVNKLFNQALKAFPCSRTLKEVRSGHSVSVPVGPRSGTMSVARSMSFRWSAPAVPLPARQSANIKQASTSQLIPGSSEQVLDEVSALCTQAIFEPSSEKVFRIVRRYVYQKLIDRFGLTAKRDNALFIALNSNKDIVGVVGVTVLPLTCEGQENGDDVAKRPLVEFLSVAPSQRGKGIGKSLVERVEVQARAWGYDEVLLQVVADNTVAIRLYEKLGYRVTAEDDTLVRPGQPNWWGSVDFVRALHFCMRKKLGSLIPFFPKYPR